MDEISVCVKGGLVRALEWMYELSCFEALVYHRL